MPATFQGIGPGNTMGRYSRDSVERALTLHFGQGGDFGWTPGLNGGYLIPTGIGIVRLRSLREAWLFVVSHQEAKKRLERAGAGHNG